MSFDTHDDFLPASGSSDGGPAPSRFTLLGADDLRSMPDLPWSVRHILPALGVAAIYGPSGSGKTFLLLELCRCLAEARSFFGYGIARQHRVVIVCLEGEIGVRRRVRAVEVATGCPFPANVRFIFDALDLLEGGDLAQLADAIAADGGADVVCIDTLNRAMPGADENSARDASTVIAALGWLQRALACLVIAVHHSGKDEARGLRGHSSLFGALDAVLQVRRVAGLREWKAEKTKDDEEGPAHPFTLERVELGRDSMDDPITSCLVRSVDAPVDCAPRPPASKNQRIVYDALGPLFQAAKAFGQASAPPNRPCLLLEDVIHTVKDRVPAEPRRQATRVREAVSGMVAGGILGFEGGWIWLK